jgi:protein-disulfide isomerase
MSGLGSAPVPAPGPDDHIRPFGAAPSGARETTVIVYADFECPHCAVVELRCRPLPLTIVFRHFPVRSSHPRAWAAAAAAEAAGAQGHFWEMHDLLFADQGRLEDPHLWQRAERLGLDLERFDADRHAEETRARVERDFRAGIRAGVVTTPTLFIWDEAGGRARATNLVALELAAG